MAFTPYLFLEGRADEAIAFYARVLGARTKAVMRHRDNPRPPPPGSMPAGYEDRIMHAEILIGDNTLMLSDESYGAPAQFAGFGLYLPARDREHAMRLVAGLSEGGEVHMALGPTFFSETFGMVQDRFGILWMIVVPEETPP